MAELAGFIETSRTGLIRRRTIYTPQALKSPAQRQKRAELFEALQMIDLAAKLGASEVELIAGWQFGSDGGADAALAQMAAASGSDEAVAKLAERLIADNATMSLFYLLPRLDAAHKRTFVLAALAGDSNSLYLINSTDEIEPGSFSRNDLLSSRIYKATRAAFAGQNDAERNAAAASLGSLAFLADADAATAMLADLTAAGLPTADPSLALLRLNAALAAYRPDRSQTA